LQQITVGTEGLQGRNHRCSIEPGDPQQLTGHEYEHSGLLTRDLTYDAGVEEEAVSHDEKDIHAWHHYA
jgi:hypothetical protein